jgi:hypothetical protein
MVWVLNPSRGKRFFFSKMTLPALGPNQSPSQWYWGSFPELKQPGPEANYSTSLNVVVENEWCYIFASHISLHSIDRENCTLGNIY